MGRPPKALHPDLARELQAIRNELAAQRVLIEQLTGLRLLLCQIVAAVRRDDHHLKEAAD